MGRYINCIVCGEEVKKTSNVQKYCKACANKVINKKKRQQRLANLEKYRELSRKYWQTHKKEKREYSKKYYEKNREKIIEKHKIYDKEHALERRLYNKKWREKNIERYRERSRRYAKKHREEIKEYLRGYHDNKKFDGNRNKILKRDNYTCQICGNKEKLIVHHKDETINSKVKNNDLNNLITLCRGCHFTVHGLANILKKIKKVKRISYEEIIERMIK